MTDIVKYWKYLALFFLRSCFYFYLFPLLSVLLARAQKSLPGIASNKKSRFIKISKFLGAASTLSLLWLLSTIYNISQSLDSAGCVLKSSNVRQPMEIPQLTWHYLFLNQPFVNKKIPLSCSFNLLVVMPLVPGETIPGWLCCVVTLTAFCCRESSHIFPR